MTHAVVLAGGGASAAFEVGVLLQMDKKGVGIDAIYGTSAGALNATGYSYIGSDGLEALWRDIKSWKDLWSINYGVLVGYGDGIMSTKPLRQKIEAVIKDRAPRIKTTVTKVDLRSGDLVFSVAGERGFAASVEASSAMPGIISPVGGRYSDGGIRENCPLKRAIDDGHDHVSVVLCHPMFAIEPWTSKKGFLALLDVALRAEAIRSSEVIKDDLSRVYLGGATVTVYAPTRELLGCLDFEPAKIAEAIDEGEKADGKLYNTAG